MITNIYNTLIHHPLYNGLIYLIDILPWADAGIAVIIFTCIIRLILFPLSKKSIITQVRMKEIQPLVEEIRRKYKDDQQKQSLETMKIYREKNVNPFSSIFLIFIQLPIIFSLYAIFARSGLPTVTTDILYSFVKVPVIDMNFLGLIDISQKSTLLAFITAITQYYQIRYSLSRSPMNFPTESSNKVSFQNQLAKSMTTSMKYVFPVMVFSISLTLPAVLPLYWIVSNLFTLGQEIIIRRHIVEQKPL